MCPVRIHLISGGEGGIRTVSVRSMLTSYSFCEREKRQNRSFRRIGYIAGTRTNGACRGGVDSSRFGVAAVGRGIARVKGSSRCNASLDQKTRKVRINSAQATLLNVEC